MYEALTYIYEGGIDEIESVELITENREYTYLHENGISVFDGTQESMFLSGLALLVSEP